MTGNVCCQRQLYGTKVSYNVTRTAFGQEGWLEPMQLTEKEEKGTKMKMMTKITLVFVLSKANA